VSSMGVVLNDTLKDNKEHSLQNLQTDKHNKPNNNRLSLDNI